MSKPTFGQALERAIQHEKSDLISVNRSLMEASVGTKKKPAFVKVAVSNEMAKGIMHRKSVAFMIHIDGDLMNQIVAELEKASAHSAIEPTEQTQAE